MKKNIVVLVDKKDREKGLVDKTKAHLKNGLLHRAFVVLVFDEKNRLLVQQRSSGKMLWPRHWDCSCASHPYPKEGYKAAAKRRLKEELGFSCDLENLGFFQYKAKYKEVGSENEVCTVLVGRYKGKIKPDSQEVVDWKWTEIKSLQEDIAREPQKYTPWLEFALNEFLQRQENQIQTAEKINSFLKETSKTVTPLMRELLLLDVGEKNQKLIEYQIATGGKRIRPALAIAACRLLAGKTKDVLYPAAGLEILHNYTLIVDDIIDNSALRRNQPTVWAKFGKSIAECIYIDYSATIFQAANRSKEPAQISEIFSKTLKKIFAGEVMDILFEQVGREEDPFVVQNRYRHITEKDYLEMVAKKTASLFETCCEMGAICANAKEGEIKLLKNYGFNLGMAFQIIDDILDIFGKEKEFGKKIGKDIEEGKAGNAVIYFACQKFSEKEKREFWDILRKKKVTGKEIEKAVAIIEKTNAKEQALGYGKEFVRKAKENLKKLPQNKWNRLLAEMADLVISREK